MTALSILTAARDWLAVGPERWCENPHVMEIVAHARGRRSVEKGAWSRMIDAFYNATGRAGIMCWQDSLPPGRAGWEQVIQALDKAIEAERQRGATQ